eukprot:114565-Chlamydomonas_euryale.AAC.2
MRGGLLVDGGGAPKMPQAGGFVGDSVEQCVAHQGRWHTLGRPMIEPSVAHICPGLKAAFTCMHSHALEVEAWGWRGRGVGRSRSRACALE